ncbi:MAG: PQQ-dependent sugar dehydrogenase [Anaerolineaceae bacterium]|nr:PQQ-dependent sugar dehydrogenase [Anaerolineaceae bacterium]
MIPPFVTNRWHPGRRLSGYACLGIGRVVAVLVVSLLALSVLPALAQETTPRAESTPETPTPLPPPPPTRPGPSRYRLHLVASGLYRPVYLTHAGDGSDRLFVLEQNGRIRLLVDDVLQPEPWLDLTAHVSRDSMRQFSERGLLGLAFHPDFEDNGRLFVHYNDHRGDTVLERYSLRPDDPARVDMASRLPILRVQQPFSNHNGGQIEFGPDGFLYMGLGDGGSAGDPLKHGQNPATLLGTILRLDVDVEGGYGIPPDNPGLTRNLLLAPQIWAWGLRNPWRFSFDRITGELYISDVGQNRLEEVNVQPADSPGGINYGWRPMEGSLPYSGETITPDMQLPALEYGREDGCSITGGYVYRGFSLPELQGIYFYGDWCSGFVWAAWRDASGVWQNMRFAESRLQITSFGEDEDGELYVLDYAGAIYRLVRA